MKNEGENVKRFICVLLALCLFPVCVFAVENENFSIYSLVFGGHDIKDYEPTIKDNIHIYQMDGCALYFRVENNEINSLLIKGTGDYFLSYSYAALLVFDPDTSHAAFNGGQLLGAYLMSSDSEEHYGYTYTNCTFSVRKEGEGYTFTIVR